MSPAPTSTGSAADRRRPGRGSRLRTAGTRRTVPPSPALRRRRWVRAVSARPSDDRRRRQRQEAAEQDEDRHEHRRRRARRPGDRSARRRVGRCCDRLEGRPLVERPFVGRRLDRCRLGRSWRGRSPVASSGPARRTSVRRSSGQSLAHVAPVRLSPPRPRGGRARSRASAAFAQQPVEAAGRVRDEVDVERADALLEDAPHRLAEVGHDPHEGQAGEPGGLDRARRSRRAGARPRRASARG